MWRVFHNTFRVIGVLFAIELTAGPSVELCHTVRFPSPQVSRTSDGLTRVSVTDCEPDFQTARPVLPIRGVTLELPAGAEIITLTLTPGTLRETPLATPVEWGQPPHLQAEPAVTVAPDPDIYGGTRPYPDITTPSWRADTTDGALLLSVQVPPVLFDPRHQALLAAESMTITVSYRNRQPAASLSTLLPSPLEPGPHTYAIISTSNLIYQAPGPWNLQALCAARARSGFTPALVTTEWISEHYEGTNLPLRIRAFVQDAHRNWGLKYLLLAGTFDLLPVQRLYVSFMDFFYNRTAEIPADALFYGCMDGTFDNNGNGRYGELTDGLNGGDVDLTAEVMVGRFPVSNTVELAHMVRKTLRYEGASAQDHQPHAFVAEKINMGTLVYSDGYMEELRFGSANNGLSSLGFKTSAYMDSFNSDFTLYDSDAYLFNAGDAVSYLNQNLATVSHMGHGSAAQCFKIPLSQAAYRNAIGSFTNDMPYFIYSQACDCGALDTPDCFAEQIVTVSNAAFAAVMNAREGWEYANIVGGFSHRYHRAFWDAALRGTATRLGEINEQSRRMHLHLLATTNANYWRWVFYELNLFGDPATPYAAAVNLVPPTIEHLPLINTYDTQALHRVTCTVEPIGIYDPDTVRLAWSTDRDTSLTRTQSMTQASGNLFEAFIDAQPANTRISYVLLAKNLAGLETRSPETDSFVFSVTDRLTLSILGSPTDYGMTEPDYGAHFFASGLVASASAPSTVFLSDETRVSNIGFFGTGSAPQTGTNQTVTFQMDRSSLLVWMWQTEYQLQLLSNIGTPPVQTFWAPHGTAFPIPSASEQILVSNNTAFAFAEWRLDGVRSPAAPSNSDPAFGSLFMDAPHALTAHYLPADLDDDANGISDWWELRYFGDNGQDPESDSDNDGYTLSEEYEDRSNPLSSAVVPAPPAISFTPLAETQAQPGPFTVRAVITDTYEVSSAVLSWHRRTEAWQSTPMRLLSNHVFEAQFGWTSAPGDDFEYQISASDPAGRTSLTDVFYLFLCYPVADTSRFHDLAFVTLPTQSTVGAYMNLHNMGNADLVWSMQFARVESVLDPSLPCWNRASLDQAWEVSTNRFISAPYALHSGLHSSNLSTGPAVRATLTMPSAVIGPNATLSFRYWINSELDSNVTRAFDGGMIEYSLDSGTTFEQLKGPYTHTIYGWTYSPWTNGTPCLAGNGTEGWRTITFDFAKEYPAENGFQGRTLTLRFHYGADNNTDKEGWYVDDVMLKPIHWPKGFQSNVEPTYNFTIPAGGNKRIYWSNLPSIMDLRDDNMSVFILSNDPVSPADSFFWQMRIRDYPLVPELHAVQSSYGDGHVGITAAVADLDGEPVNLTFDWSDDKGKTWSPASVTNMTLSVGNVPSNTLSRSVTNLPTASKGILLTNQFSAVWASREISPAITVSTQMLFRVTATNGYFGKSYTSMPFLIDNEPPCFTAGMLTVAPCSAVGTYALTTNSLALAWPAATDNPSRHLTYRLIDSQEERVPAVSSTSLTALVTADLALSNALDRTHRFEVVALDPAGNASDPLTVSLLVLNPSADYDEDGMCNFDEETAGTLVTDPTSRFIVAMQPSTDKPGHLALSWNSVADRHYTVEATPSLLPPAWAPLPEYTDILGTGLPITIECPDIEPSNFFRLRVANPQ